MDKKSSGKSGSGPESEEELLNMEMVASANDCTGLIPSAPDSGIEAESYADLYTIPKKHDKNSDKSGGKNK